MYTHELMELQTSVLFALQMRIGAVQVNVVLVKKLCSVFYDSDIKSVSRICDSYVASL